MDRRQWQHAPRQCGWDGRRQDHHQGRYRGRRRSPSLSSSPDDKHKAAKIAKAQKVLKNADPQYAAFLKAEAEKEQEAIYQRQGRLLADVLKNQGLSSGSASAAGSGQVQLQPPPGATLHQFPPAPPDGGFTEKQLEQIQNMIKATLPASPSSSVAPAGNQEKLTSEEKAIIRKVFKGKVACSSGTLEEFKGEFDEAWKCAPVREAFKKYAKDNGKNEEDIPHLKVAKAVFFWKLLKGKP